MLKTMSIALISTILSSAYASEMIVTTNPARTAKTLAERYGAENSDWGSAKASHCYEEKENVYSCLVIYAIMGPGGGGKFIQHDTCTIPFQITSNGRYQTSEDLMTCR